MSMSDIRHEAGLSNPTVSRLSTPGFSANRVVRISLLTMIMMVLSLVLAVTSNLQVAQAATVSATVNWGSTSGSTTSYSYGINVFQGWDNDGNGNFVAGDPNYKSSMAFMNNGILRYHRADQMNGSRVSWVTNPTTSAYAWDPAKIAGVLSQTLSTNPTRMVDITNWPTYLDDGRGHLRTDMYDAYAAFCAQLVQIVNLDQHRGVQYFEVFNEKDGDANGPYWNNQAELARIYNKVAAAMKAKDASIKVGGPGFGRPDLTDQVTTFLSNVNYTYLDFVSYHSYESGSTSDANSLIWDKAQKVGRHTTKIKSILSQYTTKNVQTFHDEFNISYNPPDSRMNNIKGAIFDALALTSIAKAGATGTMAWNESDGWYGKLDPYSSYARRPSANLYNFLNTDMGGNIVSTSVSDATKIDVMGTAGGSWKKLMLINRSEADQSVALSFSGWSSQIPDNTLFTVKRVYSWGQAYESVTYAQLKSSFNLWADTITILVLDENNKSFATNYLTNADFSAGLTGWTNWADNPEAAYTETWAGRNGAHLSHWKNSAAYRVYTYQTPTNLPNGTYTLSGWFSCSGGQYSVQFIAKFYGGSQLSVNIPSTGTYNWVQLTIPNINVTNGQVEVGLWSDASAGNWVYMDDVTLTKN